MSFCNIQTWRSRVPEGAFSRILYPLYPLFLSHVFSFLYKDKVLYVWSTIFSLLCFSLFLKYLPCFIVYIFGLMCLDLVTKLDFFSWCLTLDCVYLAFVHLPFCYWYISAHGSLYSPGVCCVTHTVWPFQLCSLKCRMSLIRN